MTSDWWRLFKAGNRNRLIVGFSLRDGGDPADGAKRRNSDAPFNYRYDGARLAKLSQAG
jgi:hypothetical protein